MIEATHRRQNEDFSEQLEALRRQVSSLSDAMGTATGRSKANGLDEKAERIASKGKKAMRMALEKGKAAVSGVETSVSANPLASIAVAFGLGILLGRMIRR